MPCASPARYRVRLRRKVTAAVPLPDFITFFTCVTVGANLVFALWCSRGFQSAVLPSRAVSLPHYGDTGDTPLPATTPPPTPRPSLTGEP